MKLYFVRHGRTEWNEEGRFQGASGDSPLLPKSIQEIEQLGHALQNTHFDRVFSSDLPRAYHTTQIILSQNQFNPIIEQRKELREWQLGRLEGHKIATMQAIYPQQIWAFRHNLAKFDYDMFGAESVYATTSRVINLIKELEGQPYEAVLFVGHGANLSASIRTLLGAKRANLRDWEGLSNGSLTILETEDFQTFNLLCWNDTSHLDSEKNQSSPT